MEDTNESITKEDISRIYSVAGRDARFLSEARALIQGLRERIDILESENQELKNKINNK